MGRPSNATLGMRSLYFFAKEIVGFRDLSPKLHESLCDKLQEAIETPGGRQGIVIPRGMFKSSLGQAAVAWAFTRRAIEKDYNYRVLVDTSTQELSREHIRWLTRFFKTNEEYRRCYGDYYGKNGRGFRADKIYVKQTEKDGRVKEANFLASSIKSEKTGRHIDLAWFDDLVTERNYQSKPLRHQAIAHFENSLQLLDPGASIIYTATTWHDGDLTGYLRRKEKEALLKGDKPPMPIYVRAALEDKHGNPDDVRGESIFPERFPTEVLKKEKADLPGTIWRAQKMNDPSNPEKAIPFKREYLYVPRKDFPTRMRFKIATVDPAFRDEDRDGGDYAAIVVGGFDNVGTWWGIDVRLGKWTASEFIEQLYDVQRTWSPNQFRIERRFTSFLEYGLRQRGAALGQMLPIVWINRDWMNKESRHGSLEPIFAANRVKFASEIAQDIRDEMEDEMERVGKSAHDDFLDALADQFNGVNPPTAGNAYEQTFPAHHEEERVIQQIRSMVGTFGYEQTREPAPSQPADIDLMLREF